MEAIFNEKKDLNSRQYLRTYMGHKELSTTAYYPPPAGEVCIWAEEANQQSDTAYINRLDFLYK